MPRDWSDSTLADRVSYLLEALAVGQNELGRRAGLEPGPMSRLANKALKVGGAPESLGAIATAAGCSFAWLALGEGQPFDQLVTADESVIHAGLCRALEVASATMNPRTLAYARAVGSWWEVDPGFRFWIGLLEDFDAKHRGVDLPPSTVR